MIEFKTIKLSTSKIYDLIRYVEDERAECIEKEVEPSEDLKDAYEAISDIFNQIHKTKHFKMSKQRAFYEWLEQCPVDFDFQMEFESQEANCTDELYTFRGIPNVKKNNDG